MLRRTFGQLTIMIASIAFVMNVSSCEDEPTPQVTADSGLDTGTVAPSICPSVSPEAGELCSLPEGTTCAFGACGTPIAECRLGAWRYGGNPPPQPPCPTEPPPADSVCPPCWPEAVTCQYGVCSGSDASTNRATASCPTGTWRLTFESCNLDAGADVQQDAAVDAD